MGDDLFDARIACRFARGHLEAENKAMLATACGSKGAKPGDLGTVVDDLERELVALHAAIRNWRLARDLTTTQLGGTPC